MLDSLRNQSFVDFEVLIIDQNRELVLDQRINDYSQYFSIKHIKPEGKGASYARNIGIKNASGKIMCFPDDDCEYRPEFLGIMDNYFDQNSVDGVVVNTMDRKDGKALANLAKKNTWIERDNVLKTVIEPGLMIKAENLKEILFDENLGVGSTNTPFWSDEGPDLVLQLLSQGKK